MLQDTGQKPSVISQTAELAAKTQRWLRMGIDVPLILAIITLLLFGLLMVYSSSWKFSIQLGQPAAYMFIRQIVWVILGTFLLVLLSRIDYHRYSKLMLPAMIGTYALLIVVLVLRDTRLGADRTILFGSVQPSELAKVVTVLYLSFWLNNHKPVLNNFTMGIIPMLLLLGINAGLVLLQPDISAAATIIVLGGILFYLAGGDMKKIVFVILGVAFFGAIVVSVSATGRIRMLDYINGLQNPVQASYHVQRSLEAIVKGGLFGVGIGRATTKFTGLPVAPTDSIFAVIMEETGLVGALFVIGLYILILWRGLYIANKAPDPLGKLLAAGLTIWIFMEAAINMGVMVNLIPFAGNALPLISAGGSSLTTTMMSFGVILNVARTTRGVIPERRPASAIVDLRGWDRRGGVPRSGRFTNTRN
ncbi:MAG: FtsW/RodA/SpoVE family cell cycle protein [Chloroflexi bacterium]|nr:FtsW/RodA/SpoVE family cell cycle protein [Chloroflexota bacterium]